MRIGHAGGGGGVAGAQRAHIPWGETGDASAASDSELRRTIAAAESGRWPGPLRLHREELALRVARDPDGHAGHIVGDEERMLALAGLHSAVAGGLGLIDRGMGAEAAAIGR